MKKAESVSGESGEGRRRQTGRRRRGEFFQPCSGATAIWCGPRRSNRGPHRFESDFTIAARWASLQLRVSVEPDCARAGEIGDTVDCGVACRRDAEDGREVRVVRRAVTDVARRHTRLRDALGVRLAEGARVVLIGTEEAVRGRLGNRAGGERCQIDRQRRLEAGQRRPAVGGRHLDRGRRAGGVGIRARRARVRLPGGIAMPGDALRTGRGGVARDVDPRRERKRHGRIAGRRVERAGRIGLHHVEHAGGERLERGRARDRQRRPEEAIRVERAGARGAAAVSVARARRQRVVVDAVPAGTRPDRAVLGTRARARSECR